MLGVKTIEARETLVQVIEVSLDESRASSQPLSVAAEWWRCLLTSRPQQLLLLSCLPLIVAYVVGGARDGICLAEALLLFVGTIAGGLTMAVYRRSESLEVSQRLCAAVQDFIKATATSESRAYAAAKDLKALGVQHGSPLVAIFPVFRDGAWQRIPKLLLVEGDIIALMGGDKAPARAEVLMRSKTGLKCPQPGEAAQVLAGQRLEVRPSSQQHFTQR
ncbi:unnamed protein product [Chrysoparadoxa australica]